MPTRRRSDTGYVVTGRRAYTAIRRNLLGAAVCATLLALCVCCCAIASTAPAAPLAKSASDRAGSPGSPEGERNARCAKPASFHSSTPNPTGKIGHRRSCPSRRHGHHEGSPPASAHGACTDAQLRPSGANLALVRAATLCLVNRERTSRGEGTLRGNGDLQVAAQAHSADMAAGNYFDHDAPDGQTPLSRMRASGYIFSSHIGYDVGENIAWGTLWLASPKAIVAGWMASPGHRANILDRAYKETGVGVSPHPIASLARGQAGAIYTQDFGRIVKP